MSAAIFRALAIGAAVSYVIAASHLVAMLSGIATIVRGAL